MWGILNTLSTSEVEEVTIDSSANWKAAKVHIPGIKMEDESNDSCSASKRNKAMSPGSMTLPTMNNWDMQAMSPYLPPDMNSIASGSMMNGGPPAYGNSYSGSNDYLSGNGPLSHLSESVNSLDPLNAMEKSLNEQVSY